MPAGDWYDDVTYTKFCLSFFFFQAEDGIRDYKVTGVQTCALPILQPGGEFRLAPKRAQPIERAHERVLGELTRQLVVSRQAVGQSVDTIHVGVVQRALRGAVPGPDFGYQFAFVHQAPSGRQGAASVNSVTRRSVGGLRGAGGRGGYACFKRIRIPTPTSTASRNDARVPTRKYSANSRSSSCLKRASDLAAMIHPTAAYSPSNTMVSARARSRDPTARPRATSIAPAVRSSSRRICNVGSSSTLRISTIPRPDTYR